MAKAAYIGVEQSYSRLSDFSVGSVVKLNENGRPVDYIVVNQGIPGNSSKYDSSCNGTWLLRMACYGKRVWHSSAVNDYANSDIHEYLNGTFLGLFDGSIQSKILQVKIPYRAGSGYAKTVTSGANGLSAKVFLLSSTELSFNHSYMPTSEGAELSYFAGLSDSSTDTKRIAYLEGAAIKWWLRSPECYSANGGQCALNVTTTGGYNSDQCWIETNGIRPALILPFDTGVRSDGLIDGAGADSVTSIARKIKKGYIGVDSVARKIKKAYIGIGGVARPFWSGGELAYYGTITGLSVGRYRLAGASNPNYAIFAGGIQSTTYQSTVDAYDKSYTRQTATALAVARQYPAGGSIGNYAIIAGGETSDSGTVVPHTNVEAYDLSLTKHTPSALSVARGVIAFASVGDYAIFAGGQHANSPYYTNVVNAYNSSLTRTDKRLSGSRREAAGASIGSYALIAGGTGVYNGGGGSPIPSVEAFDASLTITSAPILKSSAYGLSGTRAGAYAVFGGGYGSAVTSNVTAYNASLTKSTPTVLSKARMRMAAAALGSNGIFGGGGTSTISGLVATVDVYDENLTRTTPNELSSSRADLAAANIGDSALFAGGKNNKTNVDVFTIV